MNLNKKLAVAVSGAVLLMAGQFALADSTTDIVDALVGKGVLTEEEGKLISKGHDTQKKAQPMIKEKDGAFSISSPNGKNSVQLTGRMHFDYKDNNINEFGKTDAYPWSADTDSKSTADHFDMRRARIGIKGRVGGVADYLLLANIQGSSILDEAFLDINKFEPLGLKFGKFKQPMNLEIMTSSNNIDFNERSYNSQNTPEKKFGAGLHGEVKGLTYFGSMFQNNDKALSQKDDNMSYAGRATTNLAEFFENKDLVAHFGVNGFTSSYEIVPETTGNTSDDMTDKTRGTIFSYASGGAGLSNMIRAQIGGELADGKTGGTAQKGYHVAAPSSSHVNNRKAGLEAALAYNNFKLQGEYGAAYWDASTPAKTAESIKADVDTWYAEALWTITGEKYSDSYKKGAFGMLKPKSEFNFENGTGYGLWELGLRVDAVDLKNGSMNSGDDNTRFQGSVTKSPSSIDSCKVQASCQSVSGGAKSYTAGVKWVLNPNLLFKANYTYTKFDEAFAPIDIGTASAQRTAGNMKLIDHEDLLMIRGQFMF
jgi:phosphate-selective porin OprO/OprP